MTALTNSVLHREFAFAKAAKTLPELWQRNLPLSGGGSLLPVSQLHLDNPELIEKISRWREENVSAYPNRFEITSIRTKTWLKKAVLENPTRILFLIYDNSNHLCGHIGLANSLKRQGWLEIDNVLRGVRSAEIDIMHQSMNAVIQWGKDILFSDGFYLQVLASNKRAIKFYERLDFYEIDRKGLNWTSKNDEKHLVETNDPKKDDFFITMEAKKPVFNSDRLILTAGPSIGLREKVYSSDAVQTGWNNRWNSYLDRFERHISEKIGVRYALATSSCTGALHIALAALGIGPDDEVIVPEITWVASANAVRYVGATPVFADVNPITWLLDTQAVEAAITPKTRAIIPVHLYGFPCDMPALQAIAKKHSLSIIEDAAPALGARHAEKMIGSFGDFSAFSFQGAKLTVSGEGGVLLTDNEELYLKARKIWDQGRSPGTFWIEESGLKYKMSNVQAALALAQTERIDEMICAKRRINDWYQQRLKNPLYFKLYVEPNNTYSTYWMNSIQLSPEATVDQSTLIRILRERNVDTRPVFPAISQYPIWPKKQNPGVIAKSIGETAINLPSGVCLTESEVNYICDQIIDILT